MVKPVLVLHGVPHLQPESEFPLRGRNSQALLGYLALHHDHWRARDELADLLWPEADGDRACHSLSQALCDIRKALRGVAPAALEAQHSLVRFRSRSLTTDVMEIERLCNEGSMGGVLRALDQSEDPFLGGLRYSWVAARRSREASLIHSAALTAARALGDEGRVDEALTICFRLLDRNSADEQTRCLARALGAANIFRER